MSQEIIEKLEIDIGKTLSCWGNLRLSAKTVIIHGIEDHLLDQIKKDNKIECFIEDFIEQSYQYGMIDEKITANIGDRVKKSINYSKIGSISNNGEV